MPKILKHKFQSAVADGTDATLIRASNWNDDHNMWLGYRTVPTSSDTIADSDNLTLVRYNYSAAVAVGIPAPTGGAMPAGWTTELVNVGTGVVTLSGSSGATINGAASLALSQNDGVRLLSDAGPDYFGIVTRGAIPSIFSTGDAKMTYKASADVGWIMANDTTIGDASSSATGRANADTQNLFTLFWQSIADTYCPVSGGRGSTAAADFAAHKTLAIPKALGRLLALSGAASGLTARSLGTALGSETITPSLNTLVAHRHGMTSGSITGALYNAGLPADPYNYWGNSSYPIVYYDSYSLTVGSSGPFSIVQPSSFLNFMIKL